MNFFFYMQDTTSSRYKAKKFSHWLVQLEPRYWTCDVFNSWFFGLHTHDSQMNIGGVDVPFVLQKGDGNMKDHRYEGYFWGSGLNAGYQWVLSNHFNIKVSLGIGYVHARYDMSFKYFLGMVPEEGVTDANSLCKFRKLRLKDMDLQDLLINKTVTLAIEKGIIKSTSVIVDATHTGSRANFL